MKMRSRASLEPARGPAKRVVVVGAGVAGMTAAIQLAHRGLAVTVVEKAIHAGGKVAQTAVGDRVVDSGPTVLTMRWVFDALFESTGRSLEDYLQLQKADVLGRHFWPDGSSLDLHADPSRTREAIGTFAGMREAQNYEAFSRYARRIYEATLRPFLLSQRPSLSGMVREIFRSNPALIARVDAHRTMSESIASYFDDGRLRQLFGRYATYAGASPFAAPATLNLISHVESEGVHLVAGGMGQVAKALALRAVELGATFRFSETVEQIAVQNSRVQGVTVASGEYLPCDAVVVTADVAALGAGCFGKSLASPELRTAPGDRSLSAVTWAISATVSGPELARHTVCFSSSAQEEFQSLFGSRRLPTEPTVYVCAQDRNAHGTFEGVGPERFFLIVNAPATGDQNLPSDSEIDRCEKRAFYLLQKCGMRFQVNQAVRTTPRDFEARYPKTGGALYGKAAHGALASLLRPSARTKTRGLYLAGGSVHPGAGVPMAMLSGVRSAEALLADLPSIARSPQTGTHGSTSTASATTERTP